MRALAEPGRRRALTGGGALAPEALEALVVRCEEPPDEPQALAPIASADATMSTAHLTAHGRW